MKSNTTSSISHSSINSRGSSSSRQSGSSRIQNSQRRSRQINFNENVTSTTSSSNIDKLPLISSKSSDSYSEISQEGQKKIINVFLASPSKLQYADDNIHETLSESLKSKNSKDINEAHDHDFDESWSSSNGDGSNSRGVLLKSIPYVEQSFQNDMTRYTNNKMEKINLNDDFNFDFENTKKTSDNSEVPIVNVVRNNRSNSNTRDVPVKQSDAFTSASGLESITEESMLASEDYTIGVYEDILRRYLGYRQIKLSILDGVDIRFFIRSLKFSNTQSLNFYFGDEKAVEYSCKEILYLLDDKIKPLEQLKLISNSVDDNYNYYLTPLEYKKILLDVLGRSETFKYKVIDEKFIYSTGKTPEK